MKLTDQEAQSIQAETGLEPLPQDAPSQGALEEHFGQHTFYVVEQGLFVFEPVSAGDGDGADPDGAADQARAVQLAVWAEQDGRKGLAPIEPQATELVASLSAA